MDPTPPPVETIIATLGGLCGILFLGLVFAVARVRALGARLDEELSRQKSLSTTYGRITEQWFPLMDAYPYDPQGFRFLGTPIDGVQFEEDRIVFVEFKANRSGLSTGQRRIRRLIEEGYVYWEEFRFTDESGREAK